jgi:hypothetical protein
MSRIAVPPGTPRRVYSGAMRPVPRASVALATLALLSGLAFTPASAASSGIDVAPARSDLSTAPGRIVEETLTVVNLSGDDYNVSATLGDLTVDENGRFSSVAAGSGLPSAVAWGVVEPASFLLPSQHTQTVRVAFKPSPGARPSGYYAAVNFAGSTTQGSSVRATHPVLLAVDGPGALRVGKIAAISASSVSLGSTARVTLHLENTGNVYAIAAGRVTVRDALSRVTSVVTVRGTPVIPGTTRVVHINLPNPILAGRIRVSAELGFGPGVPTDSASTALIALTWWHVAGLALLLLVLVRLAVGLMRRGRDRRARRKHDKAERPADVVVALPKALTGDLQAIWEPDEPPKPAPKPETVEPEVQWRAEPEPEEAPRPLLRPVPPSPVVRSPLPAEEPPASDPTVAFEAPEPILAPPAPEPPRVPEPSDAVSAPAPPRVVEPPEVAPAEVEPVEVEPVVVEPDVVEPDAVEPVLEPAVVEPDPQPVAEPIAATQMPSAPAEVEEAPPAAARTKKLSELVKAGIPTGQPAGPEAASRRVKVAIDLLGSATGKSAERLDVAMQIIASSGVADAAGSIEKAFEDAASSARTGAMGSLALALARLESPGAPPALLRAYAVSPRAGSAMLRDALKGADPAELKEHPDLLAALPEDRRAALKLG